MAETNQLLINYYKKEEMKKVKKMMEEKLEMGEILESVNMEWISKEEVLDILGEDYEPIIKESKLADKNKDPLSTLSVTQNIPMEIAKNYKKYFEEYNKNRKEICKEKNISNGTLQKYLRLNYLIPELKELVNNKKLGINPAEHISFLDEKNQIKVAEIIQNYNYEITNKIAQKIKREFRKDKNLGEKYILSKEKIESYKDERSFKIIFTQEEIEKYFIEVPNRKIKEYIISILKNKKDVWITVYGNIDEWQRKKRNVKEKLLIYIIKKASEVYENSKI